MGYAYEDLLQAVAHAEHALAVLDPLQNTRGPAFKAQVASLGGLILYAREELARADRFAVALAEKAHAQLPLSAGGHSFRGRKNPLLP